ncbi:UNVERIFIED_CONTAM: hypothetical protein HDU68_012588, partial [Siphonaria sp. JEL0065]
MKLNVTLALIGNYCNFQYLNLHDSFVQNYSISAQQFASQVDLPGFASYLPDVGQIVAVDLINQSRDILPGIYVNVKRFTDCGDWYPDVIDYNGNTAGYASSVTARDIIEQHTDVIAAVGNEYSTTVPGLLQQLSLAQIPYCAGTSALPSLANKNQYPYVWRTFAVS